MSTSNTRSCEIQDGEINQGIKSSRSNIGPLFGLDESTLNAHIGQYDGLGPRYGMNPIPNHNHNVNPATVLYPAGLQVAEQNTFWLRKRIYGVIPLSSASYSDVNTKVTAYFWFTGLGSAAPFQYGISHSASYQTFTDGSSATNSVQAINPYMDSGLTDPTVFNSNSVFVQNYRMYSSLSSLLSHADTKYVKSVGFAVSGRKFDHKYSLANVFGAGSGSTPPGANVNKMGVVKDLFYKSFSPVSQEFEIQTINTSTLLLYKRYQYNQALLTSYFTNTTTENDATTLQLNLPSSSSVTSGVTGAGNPTYALFKSESITCVSEFTCFAAAPGKAVMAIYQDWVRSTYQISGSSKGADIQYVDPANILARPPNIGTTTLVSGTSNKYAEYGVIKQTCWRNWDPYDGATPIPNDPGVATGTRPGFLALGPANSGILRQKTTYEFTYAVFDKSTGHETNVGTPALILTGTNDYVKLLLFGYSTAAANYQYTSPAGFGSFPLALLTAPDAIQNDFVNRINMIQYRVYFRERGTFEWLPAAYFDAPSLYDTTMREVWLCEGPFAGSVGGQPGGFNDYSPLPSDSYFDTLNYRGRLFWMSQKQLAFSRSDDVFSYPVNNSVTCPKGQFLGMIAHTYPGQAEQNSRLIIFGSEEVYAARFLGAQYATQQSVRVSSTAVGNFPIDGSDFNIDIWTSHTAFSSRSACIAKGILYWWGPTGIYRDVGNQLPEKDWSEQMEPLLFGLYDPTRTSEIHSVYNDVTKEIIWFYPPNPKTGAVQRALAYKTMDDAFFIWDFGNTIIDASQIVVAQFSNSNAKDNSGSRILLTIRDSSNSSTPQRAVFFDDLCDSGDVTCNTVFLVKQVALSGSYRRLTLASGFSATLPSSGNLTVVNYQDYRDTTASNPDGIYSIVGSDGSSYIDIAPINGSWVGNDFAIETISDTSKFFPVFIESLNGFNLNITSQYWAPFGMRFWGRWMYCYQSHRVASLLRSGGQTFVTSWQSILGTGSVPRTITLTDNSRGNFQVHSQIPFTQQNAEGQAIAFTLTTTSGKFCGSRWYMQYLSYDVTDLTKNNFKTWEG